MPVHLSAPWPPSNPLTSSFIAKVRRRSSFFSLRAIAPYGGLSPVGPVGLAVLARAALSPIPPYEGIHR